MTLRRLALAASLACALAGCSFDFSVGGGESAADTAVRVIEEELVDAIGLGPIEATCNSPATEEVGATWTCTGDAGGTTIDFVAELETETFVNVETTNLIVGSQVERVSVEAGKVISDLGGFELPADAVDCGTDSIVLGVDNTMPCTVTIDGEAIDTTIEITDLENTSFEIDTDPLAPALAIPSLKATAEQTIEGELADVIGLGPIDASCDQPPSTDADASWTCTGEVGGQTAEFVAVTDGDANVNVNTTNVILADQVSAFAIAAMQQLNQSVGASLPDEAMDCGSEAIIMPPSLEFVCALDAGSEGVYDATITVTDPDTGAFTVVVGDTPRG